MDDQRKQYLAKAIISGRATDQEVSEFLEWYGHFDSLEHHMQDYHSMAELSISMHRAIASKAGITARSPQQKQKTKTRRLYTTYASIAAAVATIVFGIALYQYHQKADQAPKATSLANDIAPGKYGATITLGEKTIPLDSAKQGVIIGGPAGKTILRYNDGAAVDPEASQDQTTTQTLTASTARGQTYTFTLPDGTKVWLNADSKLEFPVQFSGKERRILMQGEAYFVVKHNLQQPFRVVSKLPGGLGQTVEDIGTEFNINAYPDESDIKTTLVEGSAAVNGKKLQPSEQARFYNGGITVKEVNPAQYVAWKDDKFVFDNETIESIMRKVARWYDVKVVYEGDKQSEKMLGSVSRFDNMSKVLKMLEQTSQARFRVEGRTVYVY